MNEETKDIGPEETQVVENAGAQAADPAPKKGRKVLYIAIAVAVLVFAAAVGVCVWANQPANEPVDKVAEAVKATGKVDESKVEEAKQEAETKASEPSAGSNAGQPAATTGSTGNSGSNGGSADKAPASQPASTPSASQPSGNGGSQGGTSQPEHVHNWVAQTEQRWVQDSAAWDEPVYSQEARTICNTCGADISGNATAHLVASGRHGCSGYHTEVVQIQTGTVHHDATGHYETVTTGYVCSGCGAAK